MGVELNKEKSFLGGDDIEGGGYFERFEVNGFDFIELFRKVENKVCLGGGGIGWLRRKIIRKFRIEVNNALSDWSEEILLNKMAIVLGDFGES